ncbi:adenylyl-sulfate kinase [Planctomycetota bacterium]
MIIWFSGMSGAGKSTIACELEQRLKKSGYSVNWIDGDIFRKATSTPGSFTKEEILNNNYRIIEHCRDIVEKSDFLIVSVISPYEQTRSFARESFGSRYFEVFVECPIDELIQRDTKGLYSKAINGQIDNLIGFSKKSVYERPCDPEIVVNTLELSLDESVEVILKELNGQ